MLSISLRDIAVAEERRQALGVADVAGEHLVIAGGRACYTGPGAWSNMATGLGLDGPVGDDDLDRLVDFYDQRGVRADIQVCPFAHPTLVRGLAARGFVLDEFENVFARILDPGEDLRAAVPRGWPAGVEVRDVASGEEEQFIDVSGSGFVAPGQAIPEADRVVARATIAHPRCISLVAWVGGVAAGAGSAEVRGQAGALFGVSVLPEYRRRGVQAALMIARLERARARGATVACITSKPGIPTERNALRLGFFLAYTKVTMTRG